MVVKNIKFYDITKKKAILIPESKTHVEHRKGRNRTVKMLIGVAPDGHKVYKIIG